MIRGDMTVTEFAKVLWNNKIKVAILLLAIAVGPDLYDDWQRKRTAEQLEADRSSVGTGASIAGALAGLLIIFALWSCTQPGV